MGQDFMTGMLPPLEADGAVEQLAWKVATTVAAEAADEVDRNARFPHESVAALKETGLLGALVPLDMGGMGAELCEVAGAVRSLAMHCASSALVLAMHSIEVLSLVRHGQTPALRELVSTIASDQLLLANGNSEVGLGGDVGRSICALTQAGAGYLLDKQALAISYGEYADAIMATARPSADAAESDQVQVVCRRSQLQLQPTSTWDTLGLRGTCSRGFHLTAAVSADDVLPVPFATVANAGAGQARQILLSAVWVGIAEAAAAKAHGYVRRAARKSIGTTPPSAVRLAELATELLQARSLLVAANVRYQQLDAKQELDNAAYVVQLRSLKVSTSALAVRIATDALGICGIEGYRRDSPYSLDRIIRDAHGGLIMVNNDRYLHDNAQLLTARKQI